MPFDPCWPLMQPFPPASKPLDRRFARVSAAPWECGKTRALVVKICRRRRRSAPGKPRDLCLPEYSSVSKKETTMSSFCLRLLASLLFGALCWTQSPSGAGHLEGCTGPAVQTIEPACPGIINDASRSPDDRQNPYVAAA